MRKLIKLNSNDLLNTFTYALANTLRDLEEGEGCYVLIEGERLYYDVVEKFIEYCDYQKLKVTRIEINKKVTLLEIYSNSVPKWFYISRESVVHGVKRYSNRPNVAISNTSHDILLYKGLYCALNVKKDSTVYWLRLQNDREL